MSDVSSGNSSGPRVVVAGHIVIDKIIDSAGQTQPRIALGGPVSYSSVALKSLGYRCEVVTKVGADFPLVCRDFLRENGGIDSDAAKVPNHDTTSFRIDRTKNPRRMWLLARCRPLSYFDFAKYLKEDRVEDCPLILNSVAGEISLSLMERISKEFDPVLVDSQGFVRRISKPGSEILFKSGLDISALSGVNVLKADRTELSSWTGTKDQDSSIRQISKFVDTLMLTQGPGVVDLYEHGQLRIRARPFKVGAKDTTGAGDVMLAAFAAKFAESQDTELSLRFAISAATLSVRDYGVEKAMLNRHEVLKGSEIVEFLDV